MGKHGAKNMCAVHYQQIVIRGGGYVAPEVKKPRIYKDTVVVNGCTLARTMNGRCREWFTCPEIGGCLDATAKLNWGGFERA